MSYFTVSNVPDIDTVLGYIATFISGLPNWTVDYGPGTPQTGPNAGGREFIAHNGACLIGLRSITTGNLASRLMLLDGVGPYTGGNVGSLNGDSGLGSYYTANSLQSGTGSPNNSDSNYNPQYYAQAYNIRGIYPVSTNVINPGPYPNLYLFSNANGDYVHVVLQTDSVNFRHMMFGNITQYGTWTNTALGGYYAGTYWSVGGYNSTNNPNPISNATSGQHAIPFQVGGCSDGTEWDWTVSYANGRSGDTANWLAPEADTNSYNGSGVSRRGGTSSARGGMNRMFSNLPISTFSGLVPMAPCVILSINDTVTPNTICPIGEIPDFRLINNTNFSDGQEFAIGDDTWKVFSMASKNGGAGSVNSGSGAFAYKKIS